MKNNLMMIMLAMALQLPAASAYSQAEENLYLGLQYAVAEYNENGISPTFNPAALVGRVGYFLHPSFSVEGRFGFGLSDDTNFVPEFGVGGIDATLELDSIFGLYGTGHIKLGQSSSIYGILGVSSVKATASVPAFPAARLAEDESSVSYGVGAEVGLGKNIGLNIEYLRYLDKSDFELDAIAAGVVFGF